MNEKLDMVRNCIDGEPIRAIDLIEFLALNLPPRENLLHPWLPKSGLCMVYAKRGIGKTFFALEIAMTVAYGLKFLSFTAPKPAKVLYIDGEMPANVMQKRLLEIRNRANLLDDKKEQLSILTPDLQDAFMPDLSTIDGQEAVRSYTDQADLVIVDNISTLCGAAKENEAESWLPLQQWALMLRKQGKSVLFVHHAGKNGNQRGTSKREDVLDTVITLKHPSDYDPAKGTCFEVHFEKARGMLGDCVKPIICQLTSNGWEYSPIEEKNYRNRSRPL